MNRKVLVSAPYIIPALDRFRSTFNENNIEIVVPQVNEHLTEEELLQLVGDIDGVICGDDPFTARVLGAAPKLKVISKWGTGIDSIDLEICQKLGIVVRNTPNAFSVPVADSVIGYILCFSRKLTWMDKDMRKGIWSKRIGRALKECTLGVIGVGNVGKAVVRRAIVFGMKIFGNDILEMPNEFILETGIEMTTKEDLLCRSDFVSLNCDLNPTSLHLIGEREFSLMKSTSYLINTARGAIIDELALINALKERRIAGAALDVFVAEPLPKESPLLEMENVLLAPHNANSSPEAWERVHTNTVYNLLEEIGRRQK